MSHSPWVRGLKFDWWFLKLENSCRTPRECVDWNHSCTKFCSSNTWSHSPWVRGLKYIISDKHTFANNIALPVSAWIEMRKRRIREKSTDQLHSPWVRGLKYIFQAIKQIHLMSHSPWVRGLKFSNLLIFSTTLLTSHSPWVRGLKYSWC